MSGARSSYGGEEPRKRDKKDKDKEKERDPEKKEKSHHIKRSTTKDLSESLKPSSEHVRHDASSSSLSHAQAERRVSPRSSAARSSGAGEARSSSGGAENSKEGKKSPSNSDKGHKHGASRLL